MTALSRLAEVVGVPVRGEGSAEVTEAVLDSRTVSDGALFFCVVGEHHDGHDHAPQAVERGAVALVCSRPLDLDVPQLVVPDVRRVMGPISAEVHGRPADQLRMVGVTGTNGKTTVVSMIGAILAAAGRTARTIGTLTGARTTPEAPDLHRLLRRFVDEGVTDVAMEVSSHALALHRVDGVRFDVAVFTNLGIDHLDFHTTPEAYFAAKARLFDPDLRRRAVVNVDDIHGQLLVDAHRDDAPVDGVSLHDLTDVEVRPEGTAARWRGTELLVPIAGRHNLSNALLAAEACRGLDVDVDAVRRGLAAMPVVPGRFETFTTPGGATVVVDYAHTPDALEQVLRAARSIGDPSAHLTVVFGCGGDRDRGKRPMMGSVAAHLADRVVVTTDNPRSEDPAAIAREIVGGITAAQGAATAEVTEIADRGAAIRAALETAGAGDVVVIAGKGHEQGQEFADRTEHFDDAEIVRALGGTPDRGGRP